MKKKVVVIHDTAKVKPSLCLNCGQENDGATALTDQPGKTSVIYPQAGDLMICWNCRHIMQWKEGGGFVELSDEKAREIAGSALLRAILSKQ